MKRLPKALDSGMCMFGSGIEWSDCASRDPSEWDAADLEIFYSIGRCHHLAIAMHRVAGHRLAVLFETEPDLLDAPNLPIPHHVFCLDADGLAHDIRGPRPTSEIVSEIGGTVGLLKPKLLVYPGERSFVRNVVERGDRCLRPVDAFDVRAASSVVRNRFPEVFEELAILRDEWLTEDRDRMRRLRT